MTDIECIREKLLERGDESVTFRQLVERFDEIEEEYKDIPWTLKQIYNNFNILIGDNTRKLGTINQGFCSCCGEEIDEYYYEFCPLCGCRLLEKKESNNNG